MKPERHPPKEARAGEISRLKVVWRPVADLKPDPGNPRRHSEKQIRQIAESIKTFEFNVPILIDCDGNIIAGHGRCLPALLLGISEVPTFH